MELDEYIDKNIQLGSSAEGLASDIADYLKTHDTEDYISLKERYEGFRKSIQKIKKHDTIQDVSMVLHDPFTYEEISAQIVRFRDKMGKAGIPSKLTEMVINEWLPNARHLDSSSLDNIAQSILE